MLVGQAAWIASRKYKWIPRLFPIDEAKQHGIRHGPYSLLSLDLDPCFGLVELDDGARQVRSILADETRLIGTRLFEDNLPDLHQLGGDTALLQAVDTADSLRRLLLSQLSNAANAFSFGMSRQYSIYSSVTLPSLEIT